VKCGAVAGCGVLAVTNAALEGGDAVTRMKPRIWRTMSHENHGEPGVRTPRVLLVDDHADTADLLRMLLTRRGFEVTTAHSVATGLAAAGGAPVSMGPQAAPNPGPASRAPPFDVLISDIHLPDGSGHDLLRQIRAVGPLPAVALSGLDRAADRESAHEAGFDAYLGKPVSIAQLVDALHSLITMGGPESPPKPPGDVDEGC
jgi:CheY-like chemotaxis protein